MKSEISLDCINTWIFETAQEAVKAAEHNDSRQFALKIIDCVIKNG